jgi:hypothetical protein
VFFVLNTELIIRFYPPTEDDSVTNWQFGQVRADVEYIDGNPLIVFPDLANVLASPAFHQHGFCVQGIWIETDKTGLAGSGNVGYTIMHLRQEHS